VSNSSTTSFCIYGTATDEYVRSEAIKAGLTCEYFNEYAEKECAVGIPWSEIQDDETGAEFKARVETLVKGILPVWCIIA
jgi:hypothetical protein